MRAKTFQPRAQAAIANNHHDLKLQAQTDNEEGGGWLPASLNWVWGVLQEDFNEDPDVSQLDPTGKLRQFANRLDEFGQSLDEVLSMIDKKFRELGQEIQDMIRRMDSNSQLVPADGSSLDIS